MVVEKATLLKDVLFFIKSDLSNNITDPISSNRPSKSSFVMTSYPSRPVNYPIITIKTLNVKAIRAGMQTTAQDITINLEIRIWARNTKERDELFDSVFNRLDSIQFTSSTGSTANNLHDLTIGSAVEVTEEGDKGIKSKVIEITYKFYNTT
ncbi:MAG: hypothetical protein AABY22_21370 [Nanoarchaeota archaeon]